MSNKLQFHLSGFVYTIFVWVGMQVIFDGISALSISTLLSSAVFGLLFAFITEQRYQKLLASGIEAPAFIGIFRRRKTIQAQTNDLVRVARRLRDALPDAQVSLQGNVITASTGKEGTVKWALVEITKDGDALAIRRPFTIWRDPTECEVLLERVARTLVEW
jgi:hypothetical protein